VDSADRMDLAEVLCGLVYLQKGIRRSPGGADQDWQKDPEELGRTRKWVSFTVLVYIVY
jgi:hypothetical protein